MGAKLTTEFVKQKLSEDGYKLLSGEYVNSKTKICVLCPNGHQSDILFRSFYNQGQRCKKCYSESQRMTKEEVSEYLTEYGYRLISEEYIGQNGNILVECPFGERFNTTFRLFKFANNRCKCESCRALKNMSKLEVVNKYLSSIGYTLKSTSYKTCMDFLDIICDKGHEIKMTWSSLYYNKHRCDKCDTESRRKYSDGERLELRTSEEYKKWRISVFERDMYTCVRCGIRGGRLCAHHKDSFDWCKERRLDISNGITLCRQCHIKFHRTYGYGDNTEIQFLDFMFNKEKVVAV